MHPFFADYYERLNALHQDARQIIEDLIPEALVWSPGPEMNSIAVLATHIAGSEDYWVSHMAGGNPTDRVRSAEFAVEQASAQELLIQLDASLDRSRSTLDQLSLDNLTTERISAPHDRAFTVGWSLLHVLDHTGSHIGHMQITRQLWEQSR